MRYALLPVAAAMLGCGGGAPLLHPAHVLAPGKMSLGAGVSGELTVRSRAAAFAPRQVEDIAVAPAMAPWVGGRVGIQGDNEGGLTYTGRAVRVDARHAFGGKDFALSVGVGGSAVLPQRPGRGDEERRVSGGGVDVPVLFGARSRSDLYAVWIGPRGGFEFLSGGLRDTTVPSATGQEPVFRDVEARHFHVGAVLGVAAGFRHVRAALELDGTFHHVTGSVAAGRGAGSQDVEIALDQVTLTPGAAVVVTF